MDRSGAQHSKHYFKGLLGLLITWGHIEGGRVSYPRTQHMVPWVLYNTPATVTSAF